MEIPDKDVDLIQAFLIRETQDFRRFRVCPGMTAKEQLETIRSRTEYIHSIVRNLQEKVKGIKGWRSLKVSSYGNTGILLRQLLLLYTFKGGDYNFQLCACGEPGCKNFNLSKERSKR